MYTKEHIPVGSILFSSLALTLTKLKDKSILMQYCMMQKDDFSK